jgi:hypothetical protein
MNGEHGHVMKINVPPNDGEPFFQFGDTEATGVLVGNIETAEACNLGWVVDVNAYLHWNSDDYLDMVLEFNLADTYTGDAKHTASVRMSGCVADAIGRAVEGAKTLAMYEHQKRGHL